jgi:hypothetical protein
MDMLKSGLPITSQEVAVAVSIPKIPAVLVVIKICEIATGSAAIVEPGLKPNQPSHRINAPITAKDML